MENFENYMSGYLEDFLNFLDANEVNLEDAKKTLDESNTDLTDIEHYIEFGPADGKVRLKIYGLLKEARSRRRWAKEQIELSTPISEWYSRNEKAIRGLRELLGAVRKIEKNQSYRAYAIKGHILDDITDQTHLMKNEMLSGERG